MMPHLHVPGINSSVSKVLLHQASSKLSTNHRASRPLITLNNCDQAFSQPVNYPANTLVSQPSSQTVNQPVSQPANQSFSKEQSRIHSVCQSVSQSISQSAGRQSGRWVGQTNCTDSHRVSQPVSESGRSVAR